MNPLTTTALVIMEIDDNPGITALEICKRLKEKNLHVNTPGIHSAIFRLNEKGYITKKKPDSVADLWPLQENPRRTTYLFATDKGRSLSYRYRTAIRSYLARTG